MWVSRVQQVPARTAAVPRDSGAAGAAVPPVPREANVHVRGLLPQQARLRVHRLRTRTLLPGASPQARTQATSKYPHQSYLVPRRKKVTDLRT